MADGDVAVMSSVVVVSCSFAVMAMILCFCRKRPCESPEAVIFRHYYDTLKSAIQSPESVADKLFAKEVIDADVKEEIYLLIFTTSKKCGILLSAVERKIKADSHSFYVLANTLQEEPSTQKVADWLLRDVKLYEGKSSTVSASWSITGLILCTTLLMLSVLDMWKLELGIAPCTFGITAGVGIYTLALIWNYRKPNGIGAMKLRENVAQSKPSKAKHMHFSADHQCVVEISEKKHHQWHSTSQHLAVRPKDLSMLRYSGPLATRRYHKAQRILMYLYLSDKADAVTGYTKAIVESNCSDDIKVIVLCHEAAIKIALQGKYRYAEGLLRKALDKSSKQGCRNNVLLQGKVFWHYALLLYNQGKHDQAVEYISKAKEKFFFAAPGIDTASVIYWEIGLKELMLASSESRNTKLSRQSFEEDYDRLIGHANCFQHDYQRTALYLYLTDKAMFHLRTFQITDEFPPVECWPTSADIQKAENCLKGVPFDVLPNEVNYYTAGYYLALCDLHLWKLNYPEARKYAREAKQQCIQLGITHKDAQRPDMRLKLLEKFQSQKMVELTKNEFEGDQELDEILPDITWPTDRHSSTT